MARWRSFDRLSRRARTEAPMCFSGLRINSQRLKARLDDSFPYTGIDGAFCDFGRCRLAQPEQPPKIPLNPGLVAVVRWHDPRSAGFR
jgi:hypothetical protein